MVQSAAPAPVQTHIVAAAMIDEKVFMLTCPLLPLRIDTISESYSTALSGP